MRFLSIILCLCLFVISISSCQKEISADTGNPANPPAVTGNLKAKINGTQWIADKLAGAARMSGFINISGISNDKKTLTITVQDSGVHRYTLDENSLNVAALVDSTEASPNAYTTNQGTFPATSGGEVNITAIDTANKKISGTFSFKVFRQMDNAQKTITEGSFTNLSYSTSLPPSSVSDTFRVKIDGVSFTPASVSGFFVSLTNQISIVANNAAATKTVGVIFPSNIIPGSYTFDFFGGTYIGQYNPDTNPMHSTASVSGTLTILEHNTATKRVRANFNFRAEELLNSANAATLTEGYLSVKYQ